MISKREDYVQLRSLAQYGKESYKRLIKNTNNVNPIYKNQDYYEQYYKNITMVLWKLYKELKKKKIKTCLGLSTIGTNFEVIPRIRNSGSTDIDVLSKRDYFIPEINCLPEILICNYNSIKKEDIEYLKAFYALKNKNLVYLMSVFMSTISSFIDYMCKNYEVIINDIENGKINPNIIIPEKIRTELENNIFPDKKRADELRKIFEEKNKSLIIPKIWTNMSMIATFSFGESSLYEEKVRNYSGNDILYVHQMYASKKSLIATIYNEEEKNYLLSYDSRIFSVYTC